MTSNTTIPNKTASIETLSNVNGVGHCQYNAPKNQVSPKALLNSKWTKVHVTNKEKHFLVTSVTFDEWQNVVECKIEAVISNNEYLLDWRELKQADKWRLGWN
ncbi:TIGR02450 family Trp-rich protein [Psychrosphaera sp. B3R10]|uniref:TIGR02450 family Trp-rich protein n=1 Tax=Psychrosphaera sp. B3R10 TaxID=2841569 RepID=UPI001C0880E5|nr:TIGR02450 family Trp-rich protein [Psychrosphaera sp. I2R16]MBU2989534.1 TIGR02450 family Trp-rich protein [Psychrosphaera sp. B3R10]